MFCHQLLVVYQNVHCVCLYLEFPVLKYLFIWFNREYVRMIKYSAGAMAAVYQSEYTGGTAVVPILIDQC